MSWSFATTCCIECFWISWDIQCNSWIWHGFGSWQILSPRICCGSGWIYLILSDLAWIQKLWVQSTPIFLDDFASSTFVSLFLGRLSGALSCCIVDLKFFFLLCSYFSVDPFIAGHDPFCNSEHGDDYCDANAMFPLSERAVGQIQRTASLPAICFANDAVGDSSLDLRDQLGSILGWRSVDYFKHRSRIRVASVFKMHKS